MKHIKQLLSKAFILVLTVLIQITALIIMLLEFRNYLILFYTVCYLISIVSVLWIVNNRMNPGFKIAWLIIIFTFPFFGIIVYLLYGGKKSGRRMHEKLDNAYSKMQLKSLERQEEVLLKLKEESPYAYLQANYIKQKSLCPLYDNSSCSYYSPGEAVYPVILEELQKAERYIFLEFFIIEKGVFWDSVLEILVEKARCGVDVRLIYDDLGSVFTLPRHFDKRMNALGIKCQVFNPFIPIVSASINNRDHRKILLIDGKTVFTGGINLADEYINRKKKFGYWKDSVVLLKGQAVWSFVVMFLSTWNYLSHSKEDVSLFQTEAPVIPKHDETGYLQPYADTPLDQECVGETVYINLINKATKYLYIMTPYLIIDNEILTALCNAAKSGVDVRLITPHIPGKKLVHMMTRSFYPILLECGIRIYEYTPGFIHSKAFAADDCYGIVGTVNLDYRSLYLHFECGVWMYRKDAVLDIKKDFLDTMAVSEEILLQNCGSRHWYIRLLSSVMRIFAPLF